MIMNLQIEITLEPNLILTDKNRDVKFNDLVVGKIIKYNKNTGIAKIEITDPISATRLMKKVNNTSFLSFNVKQ